MWRVQGFVGRALYRYNASSPLRLPQYHHVEDEVINSSSVLSSSLQSSDGSSQKEEDGERRRKRRTSHFTFAELPHYTALDAVGWGAAAVLFMQVCRRIHSQFSSGSEPRPTTDVLTVPSGLHRCGFRILLEILSRRDVLPRGRSVLCLQGVPEKHTHDQSLNQSSSSSSQHSDIEQDQQLNESPMSDHQRAHTSQDSSSVEEFLLSSCSLDNNHERTETEDINEKTVLSEEEKLNKAAQNLRHVGDISVPVILNIIGLENAKCENYEEAFTCFLEAAQLGYHKAQFNTGVCYEKGRGVSQDWEKATHYYQQAAANGHVQAQHRCAKLLLTSRRQQNVDELNTAVNLLEEAAAAGLTEAQVCLASVYSPGKDGKKSVQYLKMAAESGDDTALLFLGQCYEKGLGVHQNLSKAIEYYTQAAKAGNKQAKSFLERPNNKDSNTQDGLLRSIRSSPCFSSADLQLQQPLSSLVNCVTSSGSHPVLTHLIPHSWSTGSLCVPRAMPSLPLHFHQQKDEASACKWTLGIG